MRGPIPNLHQRHLRHVHGALVAHSQRCSKTRPSKSGETTRAESIELPRKMPTANAPDAFGVNWVEADLAQLQWNSRRGAQALFSVTPDFLEQVFGLGRGQKADVRASVLQNETH